MSSRHLVSDFIVAVKNAGAVKKPFITFSYSKVLEGMCVFLKSENYISGFEIIPHDKYPQVKRIKVTLRYYDNAHVIVDFSVVSTPGRRRYWDVIELKKHSFYDGFGYYLLTTNKGIISDRVARDLTVGGEVLCAVF